MNAALPREMEPVRVEARPSPIIATERLVLRPHRLSDARAIAKSLGDFKVSRMLAHVPQPYDLQDALDWLVPRISGLLPEWSLAVTIGGDSHVGAISLKKKMGGWRLGYWLNRSCWDRGYMTEAVSAMLESFLRQMPEERIHAGAFADNLASLNIQKKLGFQIIDADEVFSVARNRMVPHIETLLLPEDFRRPERV